MSGSGWFILIRRHFWSLVVSQSIKVLQGLHSNGWQLKWRKNGGKRWKNEERNELRTQRVHEIQHENGGKKSVEQV